MFSDELVFRRLIEAAPDAMIVADAAGHIVFVNEQVLRLFGYAQAQLLGQPVEILLPERFREGHVGHRARYAASPKTRPMGSKLELYGRRSDGSSFPIEISLSPLVTEKGSLFSAAIRDISERKHLEIASQRTNAYLRSAIESIQGSFAIFDADDRLVLCNSAYREVIARFDGGPIQNATFTELFDGALAAGIYDLGEEAAADFRARWLAYHKAPQGGLSVQKQDGRRLRVVHRRTAEGGTVVTAADVTEDVRREAELTEARAQAEAGSAAKSEFLASMSHELRTPLNAILGFAQLLRLDRKQAPTQRQIERIDQILKGGEHLLRLIDDVLDLCRIEAGKVSVSIEPVDLGEVLRSVVMTLEPMAARGGIELRSDHETADLPKLKADRTRFSQVLMNFGSNAIKYGRAGGHAAFAVSSPHEGWVRVSVIDNGIGVPADRQGKIFLPFERAGQEAGPIEGTGIGLAICRRLAEIMGGRVGFSSVPNQGSVFWIELPRYLSPAAGAPTNVPIDSPSTASPLADANGKHYTVVYIEDNPANITFMEHLLADFDRVRLLTAPTAEIGIEVVRARLPDVVIMDVNLPGMSGIEATRRLRSWPETKDIAIIGLSAAVLAGDVRRAQEVGFFRFLTKPVKVEELTATLEAVLSGAGKGAPTAGGGS